MKVFAKKLSALLLVAGMTAVLAGCGSKTETTGKDQLARIQESGTIVIAMEGTWAPWTYHDENDKLVGYDVEVGTKIAEKLGVTPTFVEGEWDGLLAGLDAGRYDIMVNGVDITEERSKKYDFSTPYAYNRTAVIVGSDNDTIHSLEDLKGKHTAVLRQLEAKRGLSGTSYNGLTRPIRNAFKANTKPITVRTKYENHELTMRIERNYLRLAEFGKLYSYSVGA